ncbi:MAG TPA: NAD(P)H-binding protein, partial [Bacteroidia bacterium]|nr:NAD(P)H-binding protein [Bacteroidia bacterium]
MSRQKVILFGAGGRTGNDLIAETLKRKHRVTAIVYDVSKVTIKHPDLTVKWGHMMNKEDIAGLVKGHHAVIGVNEPSPINPNEHIKAIGSVIEGSKKAGIGKILILGHPVYRPIENTMEFYDSWKSIALAQREALKLFQRESYLNWGYVYSSSLEPDKRTGRIDKQVNMILATPAG